MRSPGRPSERNAEVMEAVAKHGLKPHQITKEMHDQLVRCTPLGREIMLIVSRLDSEQDWAKRARANVGRLGREAKAEQKRKREIERSEAQWKREHKPEKTRIRRKSAQSVRLPIAHGDWSNESATRVQRLMQLASAAR